MPDGAGLLTTSALLAGMSAANPQDPDVQALVGQNFADRIRLLGERSPDTATSPKGARSSMQVMPGTAANPGFGIVPARDDSLNELNRVGRDYAQALRSKYGGNEALASAAYNAGPGRVDQWIQQFGDPRTGEVSNADWIARIPFAETRNYALNVTGGGLGVPGQVAGGPASVPVAGQEFRTPQLVVAEVPITAQSQSGVSSASGPAAAGAPGLSQLVALSMLQRMVAGTHALVPVNHDPFMMPKVQAPEFRAEPFRAYKVSIGTGEAPRMTSLGLPGARVPVGSAATVGGPLETGRLSTRVASQSERET